MLKLKHDWPIPKPAAGQPLVKEHAAGMSAVWNGVCQMTGLWGRGAACVVATLLRMLAACNPVDFKTRSGTMMAFMVAKPKIPGGDLAGVIAQGVGKVCMTAAL